ncbi:MAG: DUF4212 domain-containing protein [Magnetococcales bacterium]|nr:DUF4212 domain-containing protein [Magnetococcales bacterium]
MDITERHRAYWRDNRVLTVVLTLVWATVSFVAPFFAREMSVVTVLGMPLSFFMFSLASLLIYVAITGYYAWKTNRMDIQYGVSEDEEDGHGLV